MESWVIDYQTFWGETKDKKSLVWQNLRNFIMTKKYKMGNKMIPIALTAIDTGYNPLDERIDSDTDIQTEHIVYEFVATTPRTIACRGNDKMKDAIIKEEKVKRRSLLKRRYDVAVSELKEELYTKLELRSGDAGYIHFSNRLSDDYFKGLMAEVYAEILPGKWNWKKIWERNEMLDNYILARAAAEFMGLPQWNSNVWDDLKKRINAM
jgi:phage terminase large subunit GpA-like protein